LAAINTGMGVIDKLVNATDFYAILKNAQSLVDVAARQGLTVDELDALITTNLPTAQTRLANAIEAKETELGLEAGAKSEDETLTTLREQKAEVDALLHSEEESTPRNRSFLQWK